MEAVTRQVWWNVPPWLAVALYFGTVAALGIAARRGWPHLRAILRGRPAAPRGRPGAAEIGRRLAVEVLGHRTLLRDRYAGVMHLLLMYGFLGLFLATLLVFVHDTLRSFLFGVTYLVFKVLANLAGLAFLAGLVMALARRRAARTPRLERQPEVEAVLWLLVVVTVTGFLVQGARIAATQRPFDAAGFVGYLLALGWWSAGLPPAAAARLHRWLWGLHAAAVMASFASLTASGLRHIGFGTANLLLRSAVPAGVPRSVFPPAQPTAEASAGTAPVWEPTAEGPAGTASAPAGAAAVPGRTASTGAAALSGRTVAGPEVVDPAATDPAASAGTAPASDAGPGRVAPRWALAPAAATEGPPGDIGRAPAAEVARPGAVRAPELSWKQLLDAAACVRCGRCHEACPATAAGKPLSPRRVVQQVLAQMLAGDASGRTLLDRITPDEIWACTTCQACLEACPFGIEVADKLVDLRRALVEEGEAPAAAVPVLEGMASRGSAWRQPPAERPAWARDLDVRVARTGDSAEVLYWVGCAGAADPLAQQVSRAVARCLAAAGVDFMVLGSAERCTGDPARRLGDDGLFRELAAQTLAALREVRFERLVTHCAHCFNVFRKDYRELGAALPVVHHSQYLAELLRAGRLRPARLGAGRVTLHDPCYLGRQNGEVAAPRAVLDALPGVERREMPRSGVQSFCCGAGGGGAWVEVRQGSRIATLRMAEAAATGAEVIATACPFCKIMLDGESGPVGSGPRPKVLDIAELLAASLEAPAPASRRAGSG